MKLKLLQVLLEVSRRLRTKTTPPASVYFQFPIIIFCLQKNFFKVFLDISGSLLLEESTGENANIKSPSVCLGSYEHLE